MFLRTLTLRQVTREGQKRNSKLDRPKTGGKRLVAIILDKYKINKKAQ
ncbi:hypothetical protein GCM10010965_22150 [Caldalkalibacillus thermarum]|nr:hypothetical protein [Caldalkalibacillus thermarum]GGK28872.1 hypothetical protein GCM10010965_22150 [Caldalkalibacillus thermarum]